MIFPAVAVSDSGRSSLERMKQFLQEGFKEHTPKREMFWLTGEIKEKAKSVLGHAYRGLRIRYWGAGQRTAWVIDEVGKQKPITVGVFVDQGEIQAVKILAFRESRGGEVKYPFFTDQYVGASVDQHLKLNQTIDGITGATLSVRAVNKVVRLALYLHSLTPYGEQSDAS